MASFFRTPKARVGIDKFAVAKVLTNTSLSFTTALPKMLEGAVSINLPSNNTRNVIAADNKPVFASDTIVGERTLELGIVNFNDDFEKEVLGATQDGLGIISNTTSGPEILFKCRRTLEGNVYEYIQIATIKFEQPDEAGTTRGSLEGITISGMLSSPFNGELGESGIYKINTASPEFIASGLSIADFESVFFNTPGVTKISGTVTSISAVPDTMALAVGGKAKFVVTATTSTGMTFDCTVAAEAGSGDITKATVIGNEVTGVAAGVVTVTVNALGLSDTIAVTVA